MAGLISRLPADVTHALGWALIHSLWQCLGLAALAAILMAFSRRPPVRYLIATAALVAMLGAPAATFVVLVRQPAPVHLLRANPGPRFFAAAAIGSPGRAMTFGAATAAMNKGPANAPVLRTNLFPSVLARNFFPSNLLPWVVAAWFWGVALFSLRFAGGFLLMEYRRPRQFHPPEPRILALAHALQRKLGLSRAIRYFECDWLQAPAVIGWIRPVVLLPVTALTGLSETQLRAVIAHELAHIRRLDSFVNLLQVLVETLLFYHPAIWWLNRRIRAERELCCDEIAVSLTGNRVEYARALTLMAEWERAPALAMAANRGPLSQRIFHILGRKPFGSGQRLAALAAGILFFATAISAHALFGIGHPPPVAHSQVRPKLASASSHVGRIARVVLPPAKPAAEAAPGQTSDNATPSEPAPAVQTEASRQADRPAERRVAKLVLPLADLSGLVPRESLLIPVAMAANDPQGAAAAPATARPKAAICPVPSIADTADLRAVPGSDLRTVPVAINGSAKQFLLDISTNPAEISQEAVADLGLPDADSAANSTYINYIQPVALFDVKGSAGADYRPYARVASFTMGNATGHNLAFVVAKDSEMGKSKPYDGLMAGLLRHYDVELDFARNKLNYLTPTNCTDPDQVAYWRHAAVAVIPTADWDGKIQVQVDVQGQSIPAVIDTSSSHTVMRRDIAEMMLGLEAGTPEMVPDGGLKDGTGQQVYRHTFRQISFAGGVTAYNVPALIQTNSMIRDLNRRPILGSRAQFAADPSHRIPALTLGMDVLHQLHLYIVHGQQKLYVTAAE